jgi:hypothetical protein
VSDWHTNRALVYTIEAARLLCAGCGGWETRIAIQLLTMAREEADSLREMLRSERVLLVGAAQ